MANKIKPKRSYTANSVPLTTDLEAHELAINWADGVAYTKNASGQIVTVPLGGGGGGSGLSWSSVPASATASGTAGQIAYDGDYVYVATATNTWKRTALSTWSTSDVDANFYNVALLLHSDGANNSTTFTDSSQNAYSVTAFGDAKISTTQAKFGQSCRLDGTGDYLRVANAAVSIPSSTAFTLEAWVYLTASQSSYMMIAGDDNAGGSKYLAISPTGLEAQFGGSAGTIATCTQTFSQDTWYHIALTRDSSNVVRMFVDGTSKTVTQGTQSGAFLDQGTYGFIGAWGYTTDPYRLNGYIDDVRITKAVARYTASFTPPAAAFPDQGPFIPPAITGLQLWLDASDASTLYDATSGGSLVAADGGVARWEDKSGNARHATQGTSGKRPVRKAGVQNGKDALRLSTSAFLVNASLSANDWTIFLAAKPASSAAGSRFYFDCTTGRLILAQVQGNTTEPGWYDGTWKSGGAVTTAAQVLTWRLDDAGANLYRNGSSIKSGTYSQKAIGGDVVLFAENNTDYDHADGDVYEFILYQGALSNTDREAVENYLLAKWAIS